MYIILGLIIAAFLFIIMKYGGMEYMYHNPKEYGRNNYIDIDGIIGKQ